MANFPRQRSLGIGATDAMVFGALVVATVAALFPIYMIVLTAFKPPIDVTAGTVSPFITPTAEHFLELFGVKPSLFQFDLWLHFRNTLMAAAGSTLLSILVGVPAAYAFARVRFPGSTLGLSLLLVLRLCRRLPP